MLNVLPDSSATDMQGGPDDRIVGAAVKREFVKVLVCFDKTHADQAPATRTAASASGHDVATLSIGMGSLLAPPPEPCGRGRDA